MAFLYSFAPFGAGPSKADREDYARRATGYFDGKTFYYPAEWAIEGVDADNRVSQKQTVPSDPLPVLRPTLGQGETDEVSVTWLGHSTLVIEMHGKRILIDPVFSERCSPVSFAGPQRYTFPAVSIEELGHIDAVLITHDHYDHLDMATIKALEDTADHFVVPLGIDRHIARWIKDDSKIVNLAWWEEFNLDGLGIICTPANHQSGRVLFDRQRTLFCSFVLRDEYHQIYETGDTGYGGHFEEIHRRYGNFDLVMTDCAQYSINWHYWHMFPEESAMASRTLGAKLVMPIHWGAFVLSSHGWDDPAERLTRACEEQGIPVVTPKLGETMNIGEAQQYQNRWWRDFN